MAIFLKQDTKSLVRDQNRFRKVYRYIRKKPRPISCVQSETLVEVEWENKVYYILNENYQWQSGAITNDVFTLSSPIIAGLWMPKWMHWERVGE